MLPALPKAFLPAQTVITAQSDDCPGAGPGELYVRKKVKRSRRSRTGLYTRIDKDDKYSYCGNMKSVLSDRGQVTIPKEIRDRLGLKPGVVLDFTENDGKLVVTKVVSNDSIEESYGILKLGRTTSQVMSELRGRLNDGLAASEP
jgi:antitoxin PrlF